MSDTLFNTENGIDEYRNDDKMKKMLAGQSLLTHQEFIEWFKPPSPRILPTRGKSTATRNTNRQRTINEISDIAFNIIDKMANDVCKGKIGYEYGKKAIERISTDFGGEKDVDYDILVSVIPNYKKVNEFTGTELLEKKKLQCITGFIIVEKGECKKLNDVYSVNLICTRGRGRVIGTAKDGEPIHEYNTKSVVLLGAYLYCIKKSESIAEENKLGILELAGAYTNMNGFFAYTKVGFDKDNTLFDTEKGICFYDANNLPMSVDLNSYTLEDIIDLVTGNKKRDNVKDDTGIIEMGLPKTRKETVIQENLAILSNMKQYLILTNTDPPIHQQNRNVIDYQNIIMTKRDVSEKIKTLDEYINKEKEKLVTKNDNSRVATNVGTTLSNNLEYYNMNNNNHNTRKRRRSSQTSSRNSSSRNFSSDSSPEFLSLRKTFMKRPRKKLPKSTFKALKQASRKFNSSFSSRKSKSSFSSRKSIISRI